MKKQDMIEWLKLEFETWTEVRDFMYGVSELNGWFAYWEGTEPSDFSFCENDPRGDNNGEIITQTDFDNFDA